MAVCGPVKVTVPLLWVNAPDLDQLPATVNVPAPEETIVPALPIVTLPATLKL